MEQRDLDSIIFGIQAHSQLIFAWLWKLKQEWKLQDTWYLDRYFRELKPYMEVIIRWAYDRGLSEWKQTLPIDRTNEERS